MGTPASLLASSTGARQAAWDNPRAATTAAANRTEWDMTTRVVCQDYCVTQVGSQTARGQALEPPFHVIAE